MEGYSNNKSHQNEGMGEKTNPNFLVFILILSHFLLQSRFFIFIKTCYFWRFFYSFISIYLHFRQTYFILWKKKKKGAKQNDKTNELATFLTTWLQPARVCFQHSTAFCLVSMFSNPLIHNLVVLCCVCHHETRSHMPCGLNI